MSVRPEQHSREEVEAKISELEADYPMLAEMSRAACCGGHFEEAAAVEYGHRGRDAAADWAMWTWLLGEDA